MKHPCNLLDSGVHCAPSGWYIEAAVVSQLQAAYMCKLKLERNKV